MQIVRAGGLGVVTLVAGCSLVYGDELDKKQCKTAADCDGLDQVGRPLACVADICQAAPCTTQQECGTGNLCNEGICVVNDAGVAALACTKDSECGTGNLCGYDGFCYEKWACLDAPRDWPTPAPAFSYKTLVRRTDAPTQPSSLPTLRVVACTAADPECRNPLVTADKVVVDEANKLFTIPFVNLRAPGFTGVIRFEEAVSAGATPSLVTIYMPVTPESPLAADLFDPQTLTLSPVALFDYLFTLVKGADPQRGMLGLFVYDCGGRPAAGVSMVQSGGADALFVPVDSNSSLVTGSNVTTASGSAMLFNLPPDATAVFILRDESLQPPRTLTDQLSMIIRGKVLNQFNYYPRYSSMQKASQHAMSQQTQ